MTAVRRISIRKHVELTRARWAAENRQRAQLLRACGAARRARAAAARPSVRTNTVVNHSDEGDTHARWASYDRLQELNRAMDFTPLCEAEKERLEREAKDYYDDSILDRKVCAVTDTWVFRNVAERIPIEQLPLRAMRKVLGGHSWITEAIESYYDCTDLDDRLKGLLLSRRAYQLDAERRACLWVTTSVLKELRATDSLLMRTDVASHSFKPPKFSIADSFVAGTYPDLDELTYVERQAVSLAQIRGVVKVVYGGPGNVLQSHLLCWDNRNATIASSVPSVVEKEHFQLILAGPMTTAQELLLAQRHECSGERIHKAYHLLCSINPLYTDVEVNVDFDAQRSLEDSLLTRLDVNDDTNHLVAQARARQSTVARMTETPRGQEYQECTVVETQTVLVETIADHTEHDQLARAFANVTGNSGQYVARRSSALLSSNDPAYMERLFPHLLTFGIGGFSTSRQHRYTHREIVLHYLNLSSNRFAGDPIFKLAMFDHLSLARVKNGVFLRVGQDPTLATTVTQITPEQLRAAMTNRSEQRKAWREGRMHEPTTESRSATTVLKSINASSAKMWGSNEEREALTRKVDTMTILYGAPSVFWTLTPNPDCSLTCAFWTGHELPTRRPDDLSQCAEHHMPCSTEMARLIMSNTVVQAHYYRACSHILIDILLGWDSKACKPKAQPGMFGYVEALVYALEQQGRLFIHHHGVAWVAGMPKTQSDWSRLLASDELKSRFEQYCSSIFSSELPVYTNLPKLTCLDSNCDGDLVPAAIHQKYKHHLKSSVAAPIVATCGTCGSASSEDDIVSDLLKRQFNDLDEEQQRVSSAPAVEAIRHRFGGLSSDAATSNVQLTRLLLKDQVHAFTHTRSCIKGRSGTKCRYNFFS